MLDMTGFASVFTNGGAEAGLGAIFAAFFVFILAMLAAVYVYCALALSRIAQRTRTEPSWLAWIPGANVYLISKIAKMDGWPCLLGLGGFVFLLMAIISPVFGGVFAALVFIALGFLLMAAFMVFYFIWSWKMFEAVGRPGWWPLLALIPYLGGIIYLMMLGIAAWGVPPARSPAAPAAAVKPLAGAPSKPIVK